MRERTQEISHARLAEVAAVYTDTRVAAELFDPDWNLIWVSEELKALLGVDDDDQFGVGRHILETRSTSSGPGRPPPVAGRVEPGEPRLHPPRKTPERR